MSVVFQNFRFAIRVLAGGRPGGLRQRGKVPAGSAAVETTGVLHLEHGFAADFPAGSDAANQVSPEPHQHPGLAHQLLLVRCAPGAANGGQHF